MSTPTREELNETARDMCLLVMDPREGLTPAKPDPVTGFVGLPSGPDCRDLNPDGECEHYERGLTSGELGLALMVMIAATALALAVLLIGGAL